MSDQNRSSQEIDRLFKTVHAAVLAQQELPTSQRSTSTLSDLLPLGTQFRRDGCTQEETLRIARLYVGEAETSPANAVAVLEDLEALFLDATHELISDARQPTLAGHTAMAADAALSAQA
jgi:hypothetical protein